MRPGTLTSADCIIIDGGIDWLTLTSVSRETKANMRREFERNVAADLQRGYKIVPGGAHGYYGKRSSHALFASNGDRAMLTLSSDAAKRCALLAREGDNCTRLDVQLTIRIGEENVSSFLAKQEKRACSHRQIRGHKAMVEGKRRNLKMYQVSIGSRTSDVFIRCYDKFLESGEERFRGCVRLEAEYKGKRSQALWACLARFEFHGMSLLQLLLQDLSDRGIDTSMVDLDRQDIVLPKPKPIKENVTWGWWASQVAPSVAKSVAERGWYTAFSILFGRALTEFDKTAIMNSLSVAWGN